MSTQVSESASSIVSSTREQTLAVSTSNRWIHCCDITVSSALVSEYAPETLLPKNFLEGKGQVSLISMTAKASLDVIGGSLGIGVCSVNNSIDSLAAVRSIPDRLVVTANANTVGVEHSYDLVIPTGVARQIYPTSSALPAPTVLIATNAKASGYVTIVLEVACTGPFLSSSSLTHGS